VGGIIVEYGHNMFMESTITIIIILIVQATVVTIMNYNQDMFIAEAISQVHRQTLDLTENACQCKTL
jgi:hypothetical protein